MNSDFVILDKKFFMSAFHIKTQADVILNIILVMAGGIVGYMNVLVTDNQDSFYAIFALVGIDWVFGMARAAFVIKLENGKSSFEIRKAIKVVYYWATYSTLLALMLMVERGFEYASWLSEAIMLPIIVFQIISILKNASHLGMIPKGVLLKILDNIDNYKDEILVNNMQKEEINNNE